MREELPKKYPDKVRVVFQDFPLTNIHPWARAAAESAHCIADQKPAAFWAFHDWIFDHQKEVTAANLREKTMDIAKQQSLDKAKSLLASTPMPPPPRLTKAFNSAGFSRSANTHLLCQWPAPKPVRCLGTGCPL